MIDYRINFKISNLTLYFRHLSTEGIEQCVGDNARKDEKIIDVAKDVSTFKDLNQILVL